MAFMICHNESAIDPAPKNVIKTTRWNKTSEPCTLTVRPTYLPVTLEIPLEGLNPE
jgi:hypothetical protein